MPDLRHAWLHVPTHRKAWALCAPMILSNLTVPLVAITDSAVIGHLPHAHQLAGVAVGGMLYSVIVGVLGFLRMGTTGLCAQAAGRVDGLAIRLVLIQALALSLFLALLAGTLALPLLEMTLRSTQANPALADQAREYLQIRLLGLPAALGSYALVGWFLGLQRPRAALLVLLTVNIINVTLDLWFVLGLGWEVAGAARASVIAEWAGLLVGLMCLKPLLQAQPGQLSLRGLGQWRQWKPLLGINRDLFLRSLMLQAVFLLVTLQGTRFGETTVAANALLLNGLTLTAYALDGLAHALEALAGHAIGRRDRLALTRALTVTVGWALIGSLLFALLFAIAGPAFVRLQSDIPAVVAHAESFLGYLAVLPLIAVWSYMLDGLFVAAVRAAEMRNAMALALAASLALGWLTEALGNHGLWLTFLAFMLLRACCLGWTAWRLHRQQAWL